MMQKRSTFLILAGVAAYCFGLSLQYLRRNGSLWKPVLNHDTDRIRCRQEFLSSFRHPGMAAAYLSAACALLSLSVFEICQTPYFLEAAIATVMLIALALGLAAPDYGMSAEPAAVRTRKQEFREAAALLAATNAKRPPAQGRTFPEMTPQEAEAFLHWHVAHLPERIRALADYAAAEGSPFEPDYTPESLVPLWAWMEGHIHLRERTDEEMAKKIEQAPDWFKPIAALHTHTLSNETLDLVWDCSVYFAHVMLTNHPGLTWQLCKTRGNPCFQMPVIGGFPHRMQMEPALIVTNIARQSAQESDPERLLDIYRVWEGYLEKGCFFAKEKGHVD